MSVEIRSLLLGQRATGVPLSESDTLWPHPSLLLMRRVWCLLNLVIWRDVVFWFRTVVRQYTNITTQAQYSTCNIQLITVQTGFTLLLSTCSRSRCWEEIRGLKPTQAHRSLQSSFFWVFDFNTFCWAKTDIRSPHVGLSAQEDNTFCWLF